MVWLASLLSCLAVICRSRVAHQLEDLVRGHETPLDARRMLL